MSQKLEKWIERKRFLLNLSYGEVAEDLDVSTEQLFYFFRMYVGKEFRVWRKEMRILEAQRLMAGNPGMSLSTIGSYVGISDKGNFRRAFIEATGMTPKEWEARYVRKSRK